MIAYRNKNTGDVVELDAPSARLDRLGNWVALTDAELETATRGMDARPLRGEVSGRSFHAEHEALYAVEPGEDTRDRYRGAQGKRDAQRRRHHQHQAAAAAADRRRSRR